MTSLARALAAIGVAGAALVLLLGTPAHADWNLDCDDFATARDAQDYYEAHPISAADLDRDNDGNACDWGTEPLNRDRIGSGFDLPNPPWWVWAGGGLAALWAVGLYRIAQD